MNRTYSIVLDSGTPGNNVRRMDALSGIWTDISLPATFTGVLQDVKTGPDDADTVLVCGSRVTNFGHFGIYFSTDAGVTWTSPGGNYQSAPVDIWFHISWADQNNVYVSGEGGYIAYSSDGGANFNLISGFPTPTGLPDGTGSVKAIHFTTVNDGVAGFKGYMFLTSDGGNSWVPLAGGTQLQNPKLVSDIRGVHLDATGQVIHALGVEALYRSTDGGGSFSMEYDFVNSEGRHLTWYDDNSLWGIGDKGLRIQSTNAGATWFVLSVYNILNPFQQAGHFYSQTSGFFSQDNQIFFTTDGGATGTVSDSAFTNNAQAVWTLIDPTVCYEIERCDDRTVHRVVGDDLSAYVGQVIKVQNGTCWSVLGTTECISPVSVIILGTFDTCNECLNPPVTCYILTECDSTDSPADTKQVSTDLSAYVGQVIQIEGSTKCWEVTESVDCDCPEEVVVTYSSATCDLCPEPERTRISLREVKPGNPAACDLDKLVAARIAFAEAMYKKMIYLRYGISSCCEYDVEAAFLRQEVIDLQMIYDPEVCCPPPSPSTFTCPN